MSGRSAVPGYFRGALGLGALLVLGFVAYLLPLSGVSESRSQITMFKSFTKSLGEATAPIAPTTPGTPVALLDIPSVRVHNVVVVEGTDARRLTRGPGHRRDTPLPGQGGVSVLFGRRATFGAPFAEISQLRRGDRITTTTGLGRATYLVTAIGTGSHPPTSTAANRLVLATADSAGVPRSTISVSADLATTPAASSGTVAAITASEQALGTAGTASLVTLMMWTQLLLLISALGTYARHRWARWPAYLSFAPPTIAVVWNIYEDAAQLLPNLF